MLLGAFYPGYLLTQLPAGILIQKVGAKLTLTVNMIGTAMSALLVPRMLSASTNPLRKAAIVLTIMGMFQGARLVVVES